MLHHSLFKFLEGWFKIQLSKHTFLKRDETLVKTTTNPFVIINRDNHSIERHTYFSKITSYFCCSVKKRDNTQQSRMYPMIHVHVTWFLRQSICSALELWVAPIKHKNLIQEFDMILNIGFARIPTLCNSIIPNKMLTHQFTSGNNICI